MNGHWQKPMNCEASQPKFLNERSLLQVPVDDFHFLTRIHYEAENSPKDGVWGEHEIDYCLVIKKDVTVNANWNEVKHYEYLTQSALRAKMGEAARGNLVSSLTFTFRLLSSHTCECH